MNTLSYSHVVSKTRYSHVVSKTRYSHVVSRTRYSHVVSKTRYSHVVSKTRYSHVVSKTRYSHEACRSCDQTNGLGAGFNRQERMDRHAFTARTDGRDGGAIDVRCR